MIKNQLESLATSHTFFEKTNGFEDSSFIFLNCPNRESYVGGSTDIVGGSNLIIYKQMI
jgi:hypothetical protein